MTLEGDVSRRRLLAIVAGDPAITVRSLAARAGMSLGNVEHHLVVLKQAGLLSFGPCPHCGRNLMMTTEGEGNGSLC